MELGDLTTFITYVGQILISLMMVSFMFMMLIISRASMQRIYEVLTEEPDDSFSRKILQKNVSDGSVISATSASATSTI